MTIKKIIIFLLIAAFFLNLADFALAQERPVQEKEVNLHFFYGSTCPHCKKAEAFLEKIEAKYPLLEIERYEVYANKENAQLLSDIFESCQEPGPPRVPAIFIGGEVIVGYLGDQTTGRQIEEAVKDCLANECLDPLANINECALCQCQEGEECPCQECDCQPKEMGDQIIDYPIIGEINLSELSLPALTVVLASLDGFNPALCGFPYF